MKKLNKPLLIISFILYMIIFIWGILLKLNIESWVYGSRICYTLNGDYYVNPYYFIPLASFFIIDGDVNIFNVIFASISNIIIFIPFGIYVSFLLRTKKKSIRIILVILLSLIIEIVELVTMFGVFDSSDILLNTIGGIIGIIMYDKFRCKASDKTVNIINLSFVVIMFLVSVFAITNTFIHIDYYI